MVLLAAAIVSVGGTVSSAVVSVPIASVGPTVDCVVTPSGVVLSAAVEDSFSVIPVLESSAVCVLSVTACGVVFSDVDAAVVCSKVSASETGLEVYSAVSVSPTVDCSVMTSDVLPSAEVDVS